MKFASRSLRRRLFRSVQLRPAASHDHAVDRAGLTAEGRQQRLLGAVVERVALDEPGTGAPHRIGGPLALALRPLGRGPPGEVGEGRNVRRLADHRELGYLGAGRRQRLRDVFADRVGAVSKGDQRDVLPEQGVRGERRVDRLRERCC